MAKDIADAFRANAPGTVNEFKVVRDNLAKSGTPAQVKNLTDGVRAEFPPKTANALINCFPPGKMAGREREPARNTLFVDDDRKCTIYLFQDGSPEGEKAWGSKGSTEGSTQEGTFNRGCPRNCKRRVSAP